MSDHVALSVDNMEEAMVQYVTCFWPACVGKRLGEGGKGAREHSLSSPSPVLAWLSGW